MTEAEVFQLLYAIEDGRVELEKEPGRDSLSDYYGTVEFQTDNSWTIVVFFDCGGWDYIAQVTSPEGDQLDYEEFSERLKNYSPSKVVRRSIYGEPGYLGYWEWDED